jgi:hypothetical protein
MSDLQIITGISILISGFTQLRCGLSSYHWQVVVYLAWFSSITHLSCLTFLRSYLYNHPEERAWRLIGMGILILMLLAAFIPTGNFNWFEKVNGKYIFPGSYAICSYGTRLDTSAASFRVMVVSALLIVLGFCARVIRLHKFLSVTFMGGIGHALTDVVLTRLRRIYNWCDIQKSPKSLKRTLVYRPLLAIFLVFGALLDLAASMLVEVCNLELNVLNTHVRRSCGL